jgi:hypothetical protein
MARSVLRWDSGLIAFDAVELEAPSHEVAITEYPIELGASLTDHVRQKPVTLRMTAVVTNSPAREHGLTQMDGLSANMKLTVHVRQPLLNAPPSAQLPTSIAGIQLVKTVPVQAVVRTWDPQEQAVTRAENIYAELKRAMAEARELTVATDLLGDFDRMLLRSLRTERNGKSGNGLRLELELQQVLYAELLRRDVTHLLPRPKKPAHSRSQPTKDEGKPTTEEVDPATKRSLAHNWFGASP